MKVVKFPRKPKKTPEEAAAEYRAVVAVEAARHAIGSRPGGISARPVNVAEVRMIAGNEYQVDLSMEEAEEGLRIAQGNEAARKSATAITPDNIIKFPNIGTGIDRDEPGHAARPWLPPLAVWAGRVGLGVAGAGAVYAAVVVTYNVDHSGVPGAVIAVVYSAIGGGAIRAAREYPTAINVARVKWGVFQRWAEQLD